MATCTIVVTSTGGVATVTSSDAASFKFTTQAEQKGQVADIANAIKGLIAQVLTMPQP